MSVHFKLNNLSNVELSLRVSDGNLLFCTRTKLGISRKMKRIYFVHASDFKLIIAKCLCTVSVQLCTVE